MKQPDIQNEIVQQKKKRNKRNFLVLLFAIIFSFLLVLFALSWQDSYTLLAICNAFYFSGFILFFIGWMVFMANKNILSPLIYGLKTFFLMFAGKKPAQDYYTYTLEKEKNPINKWYIFIPLLLSLPHFATAIIIHVLLP